MSVHVCAQEGEGGRRGVKEGRFVGKMRWQYVNAVIFLGHHLTPLVLIQTSTHMGIV